MKRDDLARWGDGALRVALFGVAVVAIVVALFVKSPWVKAGVLAWILFP